MPDCFHDRSQLLMRDDSPGRSPQHAASAKVLATLLVGFGLGLITAISWTWIAFVRAYRLAWIFIEDWAKLAVYRRLSVVCSPRHPGPARLSRAAQRVPTPATDPPPSAP